MHSLTLHCYHPGLLCVSLFLLAALVSNFKRRHWRDFVVANVAASVFLASLALMVGNNCMNWLDDRPLHWHENDRTLVVLTYVNF